jgi:geranylgeranyl pyrophosphate synthase
LGIIFQIQDDILELTANNDVLGKSTFSDIERNKKTILTCLAMEKNLNDWNKLIETINKKNNIEKKELMNDFFDIKNLREESNNLLTEYINKCNEIISQLPEEIQGGLNELIGYIIKRDK